MAEHQFQIMAVMLAIEERLTALAHLTDDEDGALRTALHDILRIYGDTSQLREVISNQRDQILALADAMAVLVGRFIEHDRRIVTQHADTLFILHAMADSLGMEQIAEQARRAREALEAEANQRMAEIALSASEARELLSRARNDAQALIRSSATQAQGDIAHAAEEARERLHEESDAGSA